MFCCREDFHCLQYRDVNTTQKVFRSYSVIIDSSNVGAVFQTRYKAGFLKSFDYNQLLLFETSYSMYPIDLGTVSETVCNMRASAPISSEWSSDIKKDFESRK